MERMRDRQEQLINNMISGDKLWHGRSHWWLTSRVTTRLCLVSSLILKRPLLELYINGRSFTYRWKRCTHTANCIIPWKALMKNYLMLQDNSKQGSFTVNPHSGNWRMSLLFPSIRLGNSSEPGSNQNKSLSPATPLPCLPY